MYCRFSTLTKHIPMKRSRLIIQASTLLLFVSLISGFLLYRTGKLDNWFSHDREILQGSPNGGIIGATGTDTIPTPYSDSLRKLTLRMSSSKSMTLTDSPVFDTSLLRKAMEEQRIIDSITSRNKISDRNDQRMSSSKSLILVKPRPIAQKVDTLRYDSSKTKKQKDRP